MGLKEALYKAIKIYDGKVFPLDEVEKLCRLHAIQTGARYKISNAERRLRELAAEGDIEPMYHNKGYICGYRLKKREASGQYCLV